MVLRLTTPERIDLPITSMCSGDIARVIRAEDSSFVGTVIKRNGDAFFSLTGHSFWLPHFADVVGGVGGLYTLDESATVELLPLDTTFRIIDGED